MTCTICGVDLGPDYTTDANGTCCTNCADHPDTPADGLRIYTTEGDW
ncbi:MULTISPECIES: hypothetical protein [unclassified Streptomyces]|nr:MULTISPECIES: hypothetical protein [unclassified Streptomyces]